MRTHTKTHLKNFHTVVTSMSEFGKFDKKANELLRNYLTLTLSLRLKRMPTQEELFEELMSLMDGRIKTYLERCADAFPLVNEDKSLNPPPSEYDMVKEGYWEPR